jgi:hypothetical protein
LEKIVDKFIAKIQDIIGNNVKIKIGNDDYFINEDVYIIDHYYNGNPRPKPIIISDSSKKVIFEENHSHFKTSVIYYTDYESTQTKVYYNAKTMQLLGYRELHKNYENVNVIKYLKLNNSIKNQIIYLTYEVKYFNLDKCPDKMDTIRNLISQRVLKLKQTIDDINVVINKIKHGDLQDYKFPEGEEISIVNQFIIEQLKELKDIKIGNIFKSWKFIRNKIKTDIDKSIEKLNFKDMQYVDVKILSAYDHSGNKLINYLLQSFNQLIDQYNTKDKVKIIMLIINIIHYSYQWYNKELNFQNFQMIKFKYELYSGYIPEEKYQPFEEKESKTFANNNEFEEFERDSEYVDNTGYNDKYEFMNFERDIEGGEIYEGEVEDEYIDTNEPD